eukprot:TRINITY_DN4558_c0_g1_i1.p1 TRINITY_DN4558_c0_g1~~TRINITY_DN4558_c0_g1_i1.p1  ORF type:complete len:1029 (-),score=218.09 TRINITY_DN4558_c0_g1_i1:650-3736(-)
MTQFTIKVGLLKDGFSKTAQQQFAKAAQLAANNVEGDVLLEANIEISLIDYFGIFDDSIHVIISNSAISKTIFGSKYWNNKYILDIGLKDSDVTFGLEQLVNALDWGTFSINYCPQSVCQQIVDIANDLIENTDWNVLTETSFSSGFSMEDKLKVIESALVDQTRVLAIVALNSYAQGMVSALISYKADVGYKPQIVLVVDDCHDILQTNEYCDVNCVNDIKTYLVGSLCISKNNSFETLKILENGEQWISNIWNPNVGLGKLTMEEIRESGMSLWQNDNMVDEVPLIYDAISFIGTIAGKVCHGEVVEVLMLQEEPQEDEQYATLMNECYLQKFSTPATMESVLESETYQGILLNTDPEDIRIPLAVFGLNSGIDEEYFPLATITSITDIISVDSFEEYNWADGTNNIPDAIKIDDWPIYRRSQLISLVIGMSLVLMVGLSAWRIKVPARFLRLGMIDQTDCLVLCAFLMSIGLLRFSAVAQMAFDTSQSWGCAIRSFVGVFQFCAVLMYITLSLRNFHSIIRNYSLRRKAVLTWKKRSFLSLSFAGLFTAIIFAIWVLWVGSIGVARDIESPGNQFETVRICQFELQTDDIGPKLVKLLFSTAILLFFAVNVSYSMDIVHNVVDFLKSTSRKLHLKVIVYCNIISLGLMTLLVLSNTLSTESGTENNLNSSFRAMVWSIFGFFLPVIYMANEMWYLRRCKQKENSKTDSANQSIVPRHLFTDNSGESDLLTELFRVQKEQVPTLLYMGGQPILRPSDERSSSTCHKSDLPLNNFPIPLLRNSGKIEFERPQQQNEQVQEPNVNKEKSETNSNVCPQKLSIIVDKNGDNAVRKNLSMVANDGVETKAEPPMTCTSPTITFSNPDREPLYSQSQQRSILQQTQNSIFKTLDGNKTSITEQLEDDEGLDEPDVEPGQDDTTVATALCLRKYLQKPSDDLIEMIESPVNYCLFEDALNDLTRYEIATLVKIMVAQAQVKRKQWIHQKKVTITLENKVVLDLEKFEILAIRTRRLKGGDSKIKAINPETPF